MQIKFNSSVSRVLLAGGLLLGVAAAQAATGITVRPDDESAVKVGMDTAAVQSALGKPERVIQYGNEPGPTWTYMVQGISPAIFEVDFSADGKVASVDERPLELNN